MVDKKKFAVLDANNRLVGSKTAKDGIDFGDLPLDGTYKYDHEQGHFVPLGHGFGKVKTRQPHETDFVLAMLIDTMADQPGFEVPFAVREWRDWYEVELRRRHEELATRPR